MAGRGRGGRPPAPAIDTVIRRATPGAGLRAAAALRAAAFATNLPPSVSPLARQAYMRMRYADAWAALEARVAGQDEDWRGVAVSVWLTTIPDDDADGGDGDAFTPSLASRVRAASGDASTALVAGAGADPPPPTRALAVGTLDTNLGARLPCEALVAPAPAGGSLLYLTNVAVSPAARRAGVASSLVAAALTTPGAARVAVHVELANDGAAALYERLLGPAKAVETAAAARAAGRPRRALHWVDV